MRKLLALETSSDLCTVVLKTQKAVFVRETQGVRSHSEHLLPFIESLLHEAGLSLQHLDGLAFSAGPGSFTGIRLAASIVKALAYASQKPVISLSSLYVCAQTFFRTFPEYQTVTVINDARMGDLYVGCYQQTGVGCEAIVPDKMIKVANLGEITTEAIAGDAETILSEKERAFSIRPHALDVLSLAENAFERGEYTSGIDAQPVYLRDKSSWKTIDEQKKQKKQKG